MKRFILILFFYSLLISGASAQIFKTSLEITIRDRLGNTVEGAKVQLFKTYEDYQNETNPISEVQVTDKKGRVLFKQLESRPYYVNASKGDDNNYGDGEMVDTLVENRKNKVTVIIR
ncbi:MAG: carboxypeptidase regulatory-like domain-containing protein [Cyclobacteriaceae bacterium]|nr:carboxypeptidase regulatory-like domain-containing protein [Cyclobacteriaceae bacterium]